MRSFACDAAFVFAWRLAARISRKRPVSAFSTFALWTMVTFLRPFFTAYSKANAEMRSAPARVLTPEAMRDGMRIVANRDVVLEAHVEAFEILADQHEVDVLVAPAGHQRARGAHVGVELEFLAQAHVDRAEAAADRRGERALEREPRAADAVERIRGSGSPRLGERGHARRSALPRRKARRARRARLHRASTISGPMPSPGISVAGIDDFAVPLITTHLLPTQRPRV